jgi:hypothetical protein
LQLTPEEVAWIKRERAMRKAADFDTKNMPTEVVLKALLGGALGAAAGGHAGMFASAEGGRGQEFLRGVGAGGLTGAGLGALGEIAARHSSLQGLNPGTSDSDEAKLFDLARQVGLPWVGGQAAGYFSRVKPEEAGWVKKEKQEKEKAVENQTKTAGDVKLPPAPGDVKLLPAPSTPAGGVSELLSRLLKTPALQHLVAGGVAGAGIGALTGGEGDRLGGALRGGLTGGLAGMTAPALASVGESASPGLGAKVTGAMPESVQPHMGKSGAGLAGLAGGAAGGLMGGRSKPHKVKAEPDKEEKEDKEAQAENAAYQQLFQEVYLPAFTTKLAELGVNVPDAAALQEVLDTTARVKMAMENWNRQGFKAASDMSKRLLGEQPAEPEQPQNMDAARLGAMVAMAQ